MTVHEVVEQVYSSIPEGLVVHIQPHPLGPVLAKGKSTLYVWDYKKREWSEPKVKAIGPNISERPAKYFKGFFGKEYDDFIDSMNC